MYLQQPSSRMYLQQPSPRRRHPLLVATKLNIGLLVAAKLLVVSHLVITHIKISAQLSLHRWQRTESF
jgi:hypothetical protein